MKSVNRTCCSPRGFIRDFTTMPVYAKHQFFIHHNVLNPGHCDLKGIKGRPAGHSLTEETFHMPDLMSKLYLSLIYGQQLERGRER